MVESFELLEISFRERPKKIHESHSRLLLVDKTHHLTADISAYCPLQEIMFKVLQSSVAVLVKHWLMPTIPEQIFPTSIQCKARIGYKFEHSDQSPAFSSPFAPQCSTVARTALYFQQPFEVRFVFLPPPRSILPVKQTLRNASDITAAPPRVSTCLEPVTNYRGEPMP